ncbi:MAG: hypothetical protein WD824_08170 [Cyclobacteriaceae bacterium]
MIFPKMKFAFLLLFAIVSTHCWAQLAYPYKVYSENKNYFVKSIPFSDQVWIELGKTVIYNSKDTLTPLATIGKYFTPDYLFLSNDGKALMFLDNWVDRSVEHDPEVLTYFYLSKPSRAFKLSDLHLADSVSFLTVLYNSYSGMDGSLKYPSINRDTNVYLKGDTLYLFAHNEIVNKFLMANGKLIEREPFGDYLDSHSEWKNDRLVERLNINSTLSQQFY